MACLCTVNCLFFTTSSLVFLISSYSSPMKQRWTRHVSFCRRKMCTLIFWPVRANFVSCLPRGFISPFIKNAWLRQRCWLVCSHTDGPATAMAHWSITPLEIMVIFQGKMIIYVYINICDTLFATFFHWIMSLWCDFCEFCYFSVCPKESANILADILLTRHDMLFGMVQLTKFNDMSAHIQDILLMCWHIGSWHGIWRGGQPTWHKVGVSN